MKYSINTIINILFLILGITIFSFPRYFQPIKISLLSAIILLGVYHFLAFEKRKISLFVFFWFCGYLFFSLVWSSIGFIKGNAGASDSFRLEFLWMLLIMVFALILNINDNTIKRVIYLSSLLISLIGFYFILESKIGDLYLLSWIPFEKVRNIDGLIRTNLPNVAFMSFLFPIMLFQTLDDRDKRRKYFQISLGMSIVFIILSGRRIIQLISILSIVLFLLLKVRRVNVGRFVRITTIIASFIFLFSLINSRIHIIDFQLYYKLYIQPILVDIRTDVRYNQFIELWKFSKEHLLFGTGFGKGIPTIIRNPLKPWHYELTYSLYLYQTGIIGLTLFFSLFIILIYKLISIGGLGRSIGIGLIFYLLASGTNPYITSGFDYKFPVLLLMCYLSFNVRSSSNSLQGID